MTTDPQPQGTSSDDSRHLRRALELAARGPLPDPNPRVGAVLVDADGLPAGEGFHHGAGTPHAEVEAIADAARAGRDVRGGTAYVSLEPCAHTGRTGPCTQALLDAGIARVVYALPDVGDASSGGGAVLRAAGVDARLTDDAAVRDAAAALVGDWAFGVRHGRPRVVWKFAATLDGRSAAADGSSRWITGPVARADVHRLRARCGAILVGTGTVAADDPHLTVRTPEGDVVGDDPARRPLRVVAGLRDVPAGARVLDDAAPTLHVRSREPRVVLDRLQERGVRRVWLEGGPTLAAAFLRADLVDEVVAYVAPALLGAGRAAVTDFGAGSMADIRRFALRDVTRVGDDVRLDLAADPTTPSASALHEETP